MKKALALLTAAATMLTQLGVFSKLPSLSVNAAAIVVEPQQADDATDYTLIYDVLSNGTAEITGFTGTLPADLVIPSQIDGIDVSRIGFGAFAPSDPEAYYYSEVDPEYYAEYYDTTTPLYSPIETLTIEEGITLIDSCAFLCCQDLVEIHLPDSLTTVCNGAFAGCPNLTQVEIPSGVQTILSYAFGYDCYYEELLVFPIDGSGCITTYEPSYNTPMENFTIVGAPSSTAQTYAEENGFSFVANDSTGIEETFTYDNLNLHAGDEINISFPIQLPGGNTHMSYSIYDAATGDLIGNGEYDTDTTIPPTFSHEIITDVDAVEVVVLSDYGGIEPLSFKTSTGIIVTGTTTTSTTQTTETTTEIWSESEYVILLDSLPDKTSYKIGEPLELSGLTVSLMFYDSHGGENAVYSGVSPLNYPEVFVVDTSTYDNTTAGSYNIAISCTDAYQGFIQTTPKHFSVDVGASTETLTVPVASQTTTTASTARTTKTTTTALDMPIEQSFIYEDLGLETGDTIYFEFSTKQVYPNDFVSFALIDLATGEELYTSSYNTYEDRIPGFSYDVKSALDAVEIRVLSDYGGISIWRFETSTGIVVTGTTTTTASTVQTITTTTSPISGGIVGDVNLDGGVTMADAILLSKYVTNLVDFNAEQLKNGDCHADAGVSGNDATSLLRFLVQLIDVLPEQATQQPPTTTTDTACSTSATTTAPCYETTTETTTLSYSATVSTYTIPFDSTDPSYPTLVDSGTDAVLTNWDALYAYCVCGSADDEIDARFNELLETYDEAFFAENILLVHPISSTTTLPYAFDNIFYEGDTLHLAYSHDVYREIDSPPSVLLLMLVEIPKAQYKASDVQWHEIETFDTSFSLDEDLEDAATFYDFVQSTDAAGLITSVDALENYLTAAGLDKECAYLYNVYDEAFFASNSLIIDAFWETAPIRSYAASLSWDVGTVVGEGTCVVPIAFCDIVYPPCHLALVCVHDADFSGKTLSWQRNTAIIET